MKAIKNLLQPATDKSGVIQNYIGGSWVSASSTKELPVTSPIMERYVELLKTQVFNEH